MDEAEYKLLKKKIVDVNALISKLDSTIRADAFALLKPYLTDDDDISTLGKKSKTAKRSEAGHSDASTLIAAHPNGSPADNVVLVAAYLYGEYGTEPLGASEVKQLGDRFGLTVPHRIDNTLRVAKRKGKKLFQKVGKHTVTGEAHFKSEYKVTKGHKSRPVEVKS